MQKTAHITFTEQSAVQRCMENERRQTYMIDGYPVTVQRWMRTGILFERTNRLLIFVKPSSSGCTLDEKELRSYFETNYGPVKTFGWTLENVATIEFDE
ncbi:unnamed protein product [Rotaria sp. Silwood2]|nr:unnamed protein product [Rotaria sp. Silwood2]CAF2796248.1 unnamed protein product [Rotaria sp. Silwood2]CAF3062918.1 unnamed protein product [Rotaria sp. Silwood2]CAF4572117.1 unnamed protein product [Rotaria sp. Silwood2]CAF4596079.1 unnamed protein product [Rotaria sp. Silwood2]